MDVGIVSTLLSVYPLMVALIMSMVFKERLKPQTLLCMGMALGGIGLLYKSGDGSTLGIVGTLLVFCPSLSYAIYIVGINRPVLKDMATLKVTFYVLLLGTSLFIARFLCGKGLIIPDAGQWYLWGGLDSLGGFSCRYLIFVYYKCHTVYRLNSYRHSGRVGACYGRFLWSRGFW